MEKLVTNVRCPKGTMATKECLWWRKTQQEARSSPPRPTILCQRAAVVMGSSYLMAETKGMVINNSKDLAISYSPTINNVTANRTGKQQNGTTDFNTPSLLREARGNADPRDTEWKSSLFKFPPTLLQLNQS